MANFIDRLPLFLLYSAFSQKGDEPIVNFGVPKEVRDLERRVGLTPPVT